MNDVIDAVLVDEEDENSPAKKIRITRSGIKFIATSSVRFVVSSAITTLVPVETKKEKRKVFVASMVLSGMINERVKPYIDNEIDEALDFCHEVLNYAKKLQEKQTDSDVPNL